MNLAKATCLAIAILLAASADAKPETSIEVVGANKYLTFGSGSVLSRHAGIQTNLNVAWENGFYANLWFSRPMSGGVPKSDLINENDYGFGWNGKAGYWKIGASLTYFDEPRLGSFSKDDIWYTSLKASHGLGSVDLDLSYETYTPTKGSSLEGGHLLGFGFSKKHDVSEQIGASWFAKLAYDDGGFGCDKGFLVNCGAEMTWKINKTVTLILPRINGYLPVSVSDARKADAMVFGGLNLSF